MSERSSEKHERDVTPLSENSAVTDNGNGVSGEQNRRVITGTVVRRNVKRGGHRVTSLFSVITTIKVV